MKDALTNKAFGKVVGGKVNRGAGVFIQLNGTMKWNSGMEWNGMVPGMTTPT